MRLSAATETEAVSSGGGGTSTRARRWTFMQRLRISTQNASAPMVAGLAFAVGLVIGACTLLIPFAMSHRGSKPVESSVAAVSTGSVVASPKPVPQTEPPPAATATAPSTDDVGAACDRQAWPYITPACRQALDNRSAGKDRQVRVVTTDTNSPATITTPRPVGSPPARDSGKPSQSAAAAAPATHATTAVPDWAKQMPTTQNAQPAPAEPAAAPSVVTTASASEAQPASASDIQAKAEVAAKQASAERKQRQAREKKSGRMMVRTIEMADGRTVTIAHPIGKGGSAAAQEAIDRASERELARATPDRSRRTVADSNDLDPPAMAQADDDDLAAPRVFRHRSR